MSMEQLRERMPALRQREQALRAELQAITDRANDQATLEQWLGHSDMENTMRYLKPSRSQQVREKVNEIFG
jgi:hypothetical protein